MRNFRPFAASIASLGLLLAACQAQPATTPTPNEFADWPDELVIGFVPSREAAALVETIQPVADYLTEYLSDEAGRDINVEGRVTTDYTGLVTAMQTGQAHVGAFGPFAMLQAVDNANAEIILQSERFGSGTYHTQFFTNDPDKYCSDEPVENEREVDDQPVTYLNCNGTDRANDETPEGPIGIEALDNVEAGTTVSFVEQTSASGYIFPATIFVNAGMDVETDITALFAGSHDASVIAVCEGQAEVGASFDDARTAADPITDCDIAGDVVVFAYGPEIPNDGIAVVGSLPDNLKAAVKQALLDYADSDEGSEVLGEIYNITALTEPNLESFQIVRDAVEKLGAGG